MSYDTSFPQTIRSLFNDIAPRYDIGNSLMSFHLHALWNRKLVSLLLEKRGSFQFLDLCSGTGEISFRGLHLLKKKKSPLPQFTLVDFSEKMLEIAKSRIENFGKEKELFTLVEADATALPLEKNHYDTACIAYGIRNIQKMEKCFLEVHRVLKEGALLGIIELTRPKQALLKTLHQAYLRTYVPFVGKYLISNKEAYKYLCKSIEHFSTPETILALLKESGFSSTQTLPLAGGIATIFLAKKG